MNWIILIGQCKYCVQNCRLFVKLQIIEIVFFIPAGIAATKMVMLETGQGTKFVLNPGTRKRAMCHVWCLKLEGGHVIALIHH